MDDLEVALFQDTSISHIFRHVASSIPWPPHHLTPFPPDPSDPGGAVGVSKARRQSGLAHGQQLQGGLEGALDRWWWETKGKTRENSCRARWFHYERWGIFWSEKYIIALLGRTVLLVDLSFFFFLGVAIWELGVVVALNGISPRIMEGEVTIMVW